MSTLNRRPTTRGRTVTSSDKAICALMEGKGISPAIGLCIILVAIGECIIAEVADSQTFSRTVQLLSIYEPTEIVLPVSAMEPVRTKLVRILEENVTSSNLIPISRKYYSDPGGRQCIERLALRDDIDAIKVATRGRFFCTASLAAAFKYLETTCNMTFASHSIRIKMQPSEGLMLLDYGSARSLELLANLCDPKAGRSLLVLKHTRTAMGHRMLRASLLQPVTAPEILNNRYDALENLLQLDSSAISELSRLMSTLPDMDKLLANLIVSPSHSTLKFAEMRINDLVMLKCALRTVGPIADLVSTEPKELLLCVQEILRIDKVPALESLITEVISSETQLAKGALGMLHQQCYAVNSGLNGMLDVARQAYKEAIDDAVLLVEQYSKDHDLPIQINFENGKGFRLSLLAHELDGKALPSIFVNVSRTKHILRFSTLDLVKKNSRIAEVIHEILLMSEESIDRLISRIIEQDIAFLYKISEAIALIDMLLAFAQVSRARGYNRPEITKSLVIKSGRHPIREIDNLMPFVANDLYSTSQSRFQIISGCNMAGKSTYLRQTVLIVILAQVGCFVPAAYASIPLFDQILTRISDDEGLDLDASSFATEMRETSFILREITDQSLCIIDELGRGTSTEDGLAITMAVCEQLLCSRSTVLFSTHFTELQEILQHRPGAVSLHFQIDHEYENNKVTMLFKVAKGIKRDSLYGLRLAASTSLPRSIVSRGGDVSSALRIAMSNNNRQSRLGKVLVRRKTLLSLRDTLKQISDNSTQLEDAALKSWLGRLFDDLASPM